MRCTVPVPRPRSLAFFKIPVPFASCLRTFRSVALSIFGRPSLAPWATARLSPALTRCLIIVRSNSAKAPVNWKTNLPIGGVVSIDWWCEYSSTPHAQMWNDVEQISERAPEAVDRPRHDHIEPTAIGVFQHGIEAG